MNESHFHIAAFTIASAIMATMCHYRWKRETKELMKKVMHAEIPKMKLNDSQALNYHQRFQALPLAIQRYLHKTLFLLEDNDRGTDYVMFTPISLIKSIRCKQTGNIFVNSKWVPFESEQVSCGSPIDPGFVWSSQCAMFPNIPFLNSIKIFARDSYVNGHGKLNVNIMGTIPIVRLSGPSANAAELMRWLAEVAFYPTAFFPHDGARINYKKESRQMEGPWPHHYGSFIRATLQSLQEKDDDVEVEFCFDEQGLMTAVRAYRMEDQNKGDVILMPWECRLKNYVTMDGLIIPTEAEVGYWHGKKFDLYFKAKYHDFEFTFFE